MTAATASAGGLGHQGRVESWTPPEDAVDHSGGPKLFGRYYFAPPPEIGYVTSVRSHLKPNEDGKPLVLRLVLGTLAGSLLGGGAGVLWLLSFRRPHAIDLALAGGLAAVLGLGAFILVLAKTRFVRTCTYVGTHGVARYTVRRSRNAPPSVEVFAFASARDLFVRQRRIYSRWGFFRTSYRLVWTDDAGRGVFQLAGWHDAEVTAPKRASAYWFARATELAWTRYLEPAMHSRVAHDGYVQFDLAKAGHWVRVGYGFLDVCKRGEVGRIHAADVGRIALERGWLVVAHRDRRCAWMGNRHYVTVAYKGLANAELFLSALATYLGVELRTSRLMGATSGRWGAIGIDL